MKIIDSLPKHTAKGACYVCGSGTRRHPKDARHSTGRELLIDTGHIIDFEGHLILCETCILQTADQLGALGPEQADALRAEVTQLREANEGLLEVAQKHTRLVADLNDAGVRIPEVDDEIGVSV